MTRDMAKRIIEDEKLDDYDFFEGKSLISDEVVIYKEDDKWVVFVTDERACKVINSDFEYDNEEEALDNFIRRLRRMNRRQREKIKRYFE